MSHPLSAEKWDAYWRLMRFDRPIGIFLLLWPTVWALWFAAGGMPDVFVLSIFVAGVIVMRAGGCVINDLADRHIDSHVERTRLRPLATGEVTPGEAIALFMILMFVALGLVMMTNRLTQYLSLGGAFLAASYPFMKRYIFIPQVYLGAAFGWAVPMAYAAQSGEISPIAWLLFIATVLWATAYDTMYAMVDREDDMKLGVKSTAILFGDLDLTAIFFTQILFLLTLFLAGQQAELGWIYNLGLLGAAGLCVYQQYLMRNRDRAGCFQAFLNNNWIGVVVFVALVIETFEMPGFRLG